MLNEFKVRVNKEESQKIQELLLADGFCWGDSSKEVRHLNCNYIYSNNKRLFLLNDEHYFNKCIYKELTVEQILICYPKKEDSHNEHYNKQKIDTIARCKANMSLEQQKAICIFNIDKYIYRNKGQDLDNIKKAKDYLEWLEEIEMQLKDN